MAEIAIGKPAMYRKPSFLAPYFETAEKLPKKAGFFINTQVVLPSFKINLSPKVSVLFYMRIGNIIDAGQDVFSLVVDKRIPVTASPSLNMDIRVVNIQETGVGISAVLYDRREMAIKAGITVKKTLARFACLISTQDLTATPTMSGVNIFARYRVLVPDFQRLMQNKADFISGKNAPGQGYSTDIGFVYEYRPYRMKHRYRVTNPKGKNKNFRQRDMNKYVWRMGASLLDVGYITYSDATATDKQYEVHTSVDPRNMPAAKNYLEELTKGAKVVSEKKETKLYMPTTLLLAFDYRINNKWFLNVAYSQNMRNRKKADVFYIPTTVTGMLRKEFRNATHGIPLRIVPNTRTATVGWFTQAGPFFIGTDNVFTFFKRRMYNWSVYTGVCFTIKYKKDPTIENFKSFR